MFAYEMLFSSPELLEKMLASIINYFGRDIGMGDPMAAVLVNNLYQMSKHFDYADGDQQCILSTRLDIYAVVKRSF